MSWVLPEADDELLKLATGYPFPANGCSYLFRKDGLRPLTGGDWAEFDGRVPVIAHGSNRSPEQLQRKFTDMPAAETSIPVTRAWLADQGYDPVYGARPLKRTIQRELQNPLAGLILEGKVADGDAVQVSAGAEGLIINGEAIAPEAAA